MGFPESDVSLMLIWRGISPENKVIISNNDSKNIKFI